MICLPILALLVLQNDRSHDTQATSPFQPDEALRRVLGDGGAPRTASGIAMTQDARGLPVIHLRAVVKMASKPNAAAILEVEGVGTFPVHAGETMTFARPGYRSGGAAVQPARHDGAAAGTASPASIPSPARQDPLLVLRIESVGFDGVVAKVVGSGEVVVIR